MREPRSLGYYLVVVPGVERSRFWDKHMTGAVFSYALLAALATALLTAALTDLRRRQIANGLNLAIALAAPLWWLAMGFTPLDIGFQIALTVATFALACGLFAAGQMGGGDVKLLTALALWFTPASFLQLVILMAVLGGGGSLVMAAFNMQRVPGERGRDALAGLVTFGWIWGTGAMVFAVATRRPILPRGAADALASLLPGTWAAVLVAVLALGVFLYGFRHIMSRQKSRIEVPYGIAIAAAGLWVMGAHTLVAARLAAQTG
jgi:prepilin peptidase CpaA